MKSYIIYKSQDEKEVKKRIKQLQLNCPSLEVLLLESVPMKFWRRFARKKIKQADCAIFFVGEESHKSIYIDWEIKQFIRRDKRIYTLKLQPEYEYNETLYRKETFGNVENIDKSRYMYSKEISMDGLCKIINNNLEMDVTEEVTCNENMSGEVMIEQYKAYLQTSEELIQRRQAVSNFYITVNSALISVLSAVIAVINALGSEYALLISMIGCYVISFVGIVLCINWNRIVFSYGQLNSAKMKVISAIEKKLPFNIYDVEWKVQTDKLGKRRYVSFTNIEKRIPLLFSIIYVAMLGAAIALTISMF
jgi:hypothetical protein